MRHRHALLAGLALLVAGLDQLSKFWVLWSIGPHEAVPVIPGFFSLVLVLNRGSSFGMFNSDSITWQRPVLIIASLVAMAVIIYLAHILRERRPWQIVGLGLILGGALGNLVDRVRLGQVVDFLYFGLYGWHWPAFNVADCGITVGAATLILTMPWRDKPRETSDGSHPAKHPSDERGAHD